MKKILILLCSFVLGLLIVFFGGEQVLAQTTSQTPEEIAAEKGITFPIPELGNCSNFNSCQTFCEDPINQNTCINFAKIKGFYQEDQSSKKGEIIKAAQSELGCDSEESCRSYCSQESNYDKCSNFAQKHNLGGGQTVDPSKAQILEKAKEVLGCNSYESCRSFCENDANRQKCSEFAKQTGLRGGEQQAGPGGCTSEETCKAFCSDPANFQVCSRFQSSVSSDAKDFRGPGGCNSEESCRTYCEQNPSSCGNIGEGSQGSHEEYCNKTPNCSWQNNTCLCSSGDYPSTQNQNINPEEYCKQYPDRCSQNFSPSPSEDFATQCTKSPGCAWTGSSCLCSQAIETTTPTPIPNEPYSVQGGETIYQSQCTNAGCSWNGSYCQCPDSKGVQGASTQRGFFENLLRLILPLSK